MRGHATTGPLATSLLGRRPLDPRTLRLVSAVCSIALGASLIPVTAAIGDREVRPVREVRTTYTLEFGMRRPAGIGYLAHSGALLLAQTSAAETSAIKLTPTQDFQGALALPRAAAATLAFDPRSAGLAMLDGRDLLTVDAEQLRLSRPAARRAALGAIEVGEPAGAAFDADGNFLILDTSTRSIVRLEGAEPRRGAARIALRGLGAGRVQGIAFNPADGLIYVAIPRADRLYAVDRLGTLQRTYSLEGVDLRNPRAMAFAPSADTTDHPANLHLFFADIGDRSSFGGVTEVTLERAPAVSAPVDAATLVRTTHTSAWSPASPDPSGVTHLSGPDRLEVVDSEVDETTGAGYQGVNMWQATRKGVVTDTGTTLAFSHEPTGLGNDPATNSLFVSDDTAGKVWIDKPGADGRFGTGDDVVKAINVGPLGLTDVEDPEFDPATGTLFFIDGVNVEVYRIDPVNGVFGDGDDQVTQFDVGQYGATDVEGLGSDPVRGTLLVGDRPSRKIYEVTKQGSLVRIVDASGIPALSRISGLATAPASDGSGKLHTYIVDRGVDNGSDPKENDGAMYEITAPVTGNAPPAVYAGPDQKVVLPHPATLRGAVSDDGLPNPPGAVTSRWSMVRGPGSVGFADPTAPTTTATFSTDGTYVLRLTSDDSGAITTDEITVTVLPAGSVIPTVLEVAVASSSDDAEQRSSGTVNLGGADLELVVDGSNQQTVGIRFAGVTVPRQAAISTAYVQFTADEKSSGSAALTLRAQDADNPGTFTTAKNDVSSRPTIAPSVAWSPASWDSVGAAGPAQRTAELKALLQAIVDRPGWASGNAVALVFTGSGTRTAEAMDGTASPILHVEYTSGTPNTPPVMDGVAVTPASPTTSQTLSASVSAHDDDGDPLTYSYQWAKNGTNLTGATSSSLDLSVPGNGDRGDQLTVQVTASDGKASSAPVTSAPVSVANADPTFDQDLQDRTNRPGATVQLSAAATDPDGDPLTYAATGLPGGLSINASTGLISGTIQQTAIVGSPYSVSVTVRDGPGVDATDTFTWRVRTNVPPVLSNPGTQSSAEGEAVSLQVQASDEDGDTLSYAASGLPPGLSIDPATGLISGVIATGAAAGSPFTVEVTVDDANEGSDSELFTWTVLVGTAPARPSGLVARVTTAAIALSWDPNRGAEAAGYNVFRASRASGPYTKLNGDLLEEPSYEDPGAPVGATSYYRVTAVDREGTASGPSEVSARRTIAVRSASSATANRRLRLPIATPSGVEGGDVLIASIAVEGARELTPPSGWTLIATQTTPGDELRVALYHRTAEASEPSTHKWKLSEQAPVVGHIVAYLGVDGGSPVLASAAQASSGSSSITAPALSNSVAGAGLIALFGIGAKTSIESPGGMLEQADLAAGGTGQIAAAMADEVRGSGGAGARVAIAGAAAPNIGVSVLLRPAS